MTEAGDDRIGIRTIAPLRPFHWLRLGWRDFLRAFFPSLAHGVVAMLAGLGILAVGRYAWPLLPGAFSGFVLIAPILATGLYELSKRMERGENAQWRCVALAWARGTRPLVWLGLGLALAATLWVLVSALLIALFVTAPITGLDSFLRHVVVGEGSNLFPLWARSAASVRRWSSPRAWSRCRCCSTRRRTRRPRSPRACAQWARTPSQWRCGPR